jgi:hypothetical protein
MFEGETPCTYSEPLSWTSRRGHQTTRPPSGWPFCATPGARMGACSSLLSACRSRRWKGRSIPCKTSWTSCAREPVEPSRSHETAVCSDTSFLPDRWIVLALPSGKPSHETRPVLLHGKSILDGLAAHGRHEPAQSRCRERQRQAASGPKRVGLVNRERIRGPQAAILALGHSSLSGMDKACQRPPQWASAGIPKA